MRMTISSDVLTVSAPEQTFRQQVRSSQIQIAPSAPSALIPSHFRIFCVVGIRNSEGPFDFAFFCFFEKNWSLHERKKINLLLFELLFEFSAFNRDVKILFRLVSTALCPEVKEKQNPRFLQFNRRKHFFFTFRGSEVN